MKKLFGNIFNAPIYAVDDTPEQQATIEKISELCCFEAKMKTNMVGNVHKQFRKCLASKTKMSTAKIRCFMRNIDEENHCYTYCMPYIGSKLRCTKCRKKMNCNVPYDTCKNFKIGGPLDIEEKPIGTKWMGMKFTW